MREKNNLGLHPKGWSPLGPKEFLARAAKIPVIDVRSPAEYKQGHIPDALNVPIFDDEERKLVGIAYAQGGKNAALLKGLKLVGPKLASIADESRKISREGQVLVHCWRGGMRSESLAWLLNFIGLKVNVLDGGYKAYRRFIRESFREGPSLIVLGGMTGSGKTEVLYHLASYGEQIIDLEALAQHKGSAFGGLGMPEQPTNEQFENDLAHQWLSFRAEKTVWVEDESRNIGKVIIPEPFFTKKMKAPLILLQVPFEERLARLLNDYGNFDHNTLSDIMGKISRRMGGDKAIAAIQELNNGNTRGAIEIVLSYYDKTYSYSLKMQNNPAVYSFDASNCFDMQSVAADICKLQPEFFNRKTF